MAIDAALGRLGIKSGVCTSSTRPTNPYSGQLIYETDTNRTLVYDNAAWLVVADNQMLSIDPANGRVGINTNTPTDTLDVDGGANIQGTALIRNMSVLNQAYGPAEVLGDFSIGNTGSEAMYVDASAGRVGINDISPSYALDVTGDINATGDIRTNGNPVGLVHIKSVSVPAGSGSITVTGITGYVDYLLRFDRVDCSGNAVLIIDSADLSGSLWYGSALLWQGTATPLAYDLGGASSSGAYAGFIDTNRSSLLLHIFNPGGAGRTRYYSQGVYSTAHFHAGGVYNADTTTDEFTFSMSGSNTLSGGTIEVYGYNQ